jgi:hypothetical protein
MVAQYIADWERGIEGDGKLVTNAVEKKKMGTKQGTYIDRIERDHPGYIHEMLRYAMKVETDTATWKELAMAMQARSALPDETRPTLDKLSAKMVRLYFKSCGGKYKKMVERPIITETRKQERIEWATRLKGKVESDEPFYVAFLDEKWFYTQSRRKKRKELPLGPHEQPGAEVLPTRRIVSRRFPSKAMFMGVFGPPDTAHGFNGNIYLKRVSETQVAKQKSYSQRVSDNYRIQYEIQHNWKDLLGGDMTQTPNDIVEAIVAKWGSFIEPQVVDRLVIRYQHFTAGGAKEWKMVKMDQSCSSIQFGPSAGAPRRQLQIGDIHLYVERRKGDKFEKDTTCNSEFMLKHMRQVGMSMRGAYHWVPFETPLYLIMDNAGGHGTVGAWLEFTQELKERYNVEIIRQIPRSPETNILDLGVWCSLQSAVEKAHRNLTTSCLAALHRSVERAWISFNSEKITKVYQRWKKVLDLIIVDHGDNKLVDSHRGELFVPLVMPELPSDGLLDAVLGDASDDPGNGAEEMGENDDEELDDW